MNLPDAFQDDDICPFGKHRDERMADVPDNYFKWYWENCASQHIHAATPNGRFARYIFNNRGSLDIDVTETLKEIERKSALDKTSTLFPSGNVLVFDWETNDKPNYSQMNNPHHPSTPHGAELGVVLYANDCTVISEFSTLVKPSGWFMQPGAEAVHGISQTRCEQEGRSIGEVLSRFHSVATTQGRPDRIVTYNVEFDRLIYEAECIRIGLHPMLKAFPWECAMRRVTPICKIPSTHPRFGKYKFPKLQEAYKYFFGKEFDGAHGALSDVKATFEVYRESFDPKWSQ